MKYTVFQIPTPTNKYEEQIYHHYAFAHLDWIDTVHPEYYRKTYEGNIETSKTNIMDVLEDLFCELNIRHPVNYKGHSLSVSDVVLIDGRYWYCDSDGWVEIEF